MGGVSGPNFYAALIQPDGSLLPLFTSLEPGAINSVAINEQGVGLIGGQIGGTAAYAALVAPNGTLTPLSLSGSSIGSVAINGGGSIIDQVVPKTLGPYSSIFYSQLAFASALGTRLTQQNRLWAKKGNPTNQNVTQTGIDTSRAEANLAFSPKVEAMPKKGYSNINSNSFWFEPFANLVYLDKQGSVPEYSNQVAGSLVGYDRQGTNYIVGASVGYAFNYVHPIDGRETQSFRAGRNCRSSFNGLKLNKCIYFSQ